ncbi:zinc finger and BTB domain-containing protein 2 isoform X2 [Latimeria chalumnae]
MYTGKMAPHLIDPVRLEQGIKFLHAYPLIQEASLASHGGIHHPESVFPLASSLYGIQIADHQAMHPSKTHPTRDVMPEREHGHHSSKLDQDQSQEGGQISQGNSSLSHSSQPDLTFSEPLQAPLSPEMVQPAAPPAAEEQNMEESSTEEQPAVLTIAHVKPSIMKRNGSFPKYYNCHLCGRRFNLRSSLREHIQLHAVMPFSMTNHGEINMFPLLGNGAAELGKDAVDVPEAGMISDGELQQTTDSLLVDGQQQPETPPPTDIADIDNLEQVDVEREVKRRKYECSICGRKFIQKSHWREHMYIHTGKPFKCSTCEKSFCRANQAARHVCLNQSSETYTMVDKQTLELCSLEENSQMDNMLLHPNKPYKCNLCDKTFLSPAEVVKHSCQNQNSDIFALMESGSAAQGDSGPCETIQTEHSFSAPIKKEKEDDFID